VVREAGRETVVRFSRKSKENYVRTEVDGKPSGWTGLYVDGKWEITDKRKKPKKEKAEKEDK